MRRSRDLAELLEDERGVLDEDDHLVTDLRRQLDRLRARRGPVV